MRSKRSRNYRAEYVRRRERGIAQGKTPREYRGHAERRYPGKSESAVRSERVMLKHAVTPSVLTRLRREVVNHIMAQLAIVGTKGFVRQPQIQAGIAPLHGSTLRNILQLDGSDLKVLASLDPRSVYDTEIFEDEEYDEDNEPPNPAWYR